MEVGNEAPADRQQLQELIRKQAQKESKKLVKELNHLKTQLSTLAMGAKSTSRGRSRTSTKKENARNPSRSRQSARIQSPVDNHVPRNPRTCTNQAATADNASNADNPNSTQKKKGKPSKKKNMQSNDRNSTP